MTKHAREAEPALFAMKDITPKKGPDKKGADKKPEPKPEPKPEKKPAKAKAKRPASTAVAKHEPQRAVAKRPAPTSLLQVILDAVADPRCDTGKMRELLAMQKEIDAEEARRAFTVDYMALQDDLPAITADRRIEIRKKDRTTGERTGAVEQSTPYSSFNAIMRVIKKPLKNHGFTLSFSTEPSPDGTRLLVTGYLDHVRGHQRKTVFPLPAETSGSKNNVQGWGSSQSYGMRYGTRALLNVITNAPEDADMDGATVQQVTTDQPRAGNVKTIAHEAEPDRVPDQPKRLTLAQSEALTTLIKNCQVSVEKFCEKYGVDAVIDLNPSFYAEAEKALRAHAKKYDIALPEPK